MKTTENKLKFSKKKKRNTRQISFRNGIISRYSITRYLYFNLDINMIITIFNLNHKIVKLGFGTTNNGNTAKKFFKNAEKSADITGLNIDLIKRFGTILIVMASGYEINTDAFETYGIQTAKLFVELYTICSHLCIKFCFMELMLSGMQFYQLVF